MRSLVGVRINFATESSFAHTLRKCLFAFLGPSINRCRSIAAICEVSKASIEEVICGHPGNDLVVGKKIGNGRSFPAITAAETHNRKLRPCDGLCYAGMVKVCNASISASRTEGGPQLVFERIL